MGYGSIKNFIRSFTILILTSLTLIVMSESVISAESVLSDEVGANNLRTEPTLWTVDADTVKVRIGMVELYPWKPITKEKILPNTNPIPTDPGTNLYLKACRGEYEPTSFVIRALNDVSGLKIKAPKLIGTSGSTIPEKNVDIKLVKCWYQSGTDGKQGKRLVPELLLNDDNLVNVDLSKKNNYLRVRQENVEKYIDITSKDAAIPTDVEIYDADTLQPFNLPANTNKQIWVTIHVPESAKPGQYFGDIMLYDNNDALLKQVKINLTVLPFELVDPVIEYSIYYTPILMRSTAGRPISSQYKLPAQYKIELQNIKEHGVSYPTLYQSVSDTELFHRALMIRDELNFPKDKIYTMAMGVNTDYSIEKSLSGLPSNLFILRELLSEFKYDDVYIYGMDEAKSDKLRSQRVAWQTARTSDFKMYAACDTKAIDIVGDILDRPNLRGPFKPSIVKKWHDLGKKVFIYANPQVGNEDPEIYRRNYGILTLSNGYDGVMNFAYQYDFIASKGYIWNDFSNTTDLRNHVFAYPTTEGIIDTVQWEGFREAVDDIRYLTTLAVASKNTNYQALGTSFSAVEDLDLMREQIINRILETK